MANEMEQYMRALLGSAQGKAAAQALSHAMQQPQMQGLLALLSTENTQLLQKAAQAAVRGDEADARASLAALLQTPDGAALLRALAALQGGR